MSSQQNLVMEQVYPGGIPKTKTAPTAPPQATNSRFFSEALLEQSTARQRRSPMTWALSLSIQLAILVTLLLLPLYFSQGIDMKRLETTLLVAPMPPMAPAPPPPPAAAVRPVHVIPRVITPGKLTAPTFIPKAVATSTNEAAPPDVALSGMAAGVPGGVPGGQIGGITGGMPGIAPPVMAAPVAERPKGPVRVGGDVKPPRLISGPAPVYPVLARQSQIQGMVVIDAIIDEHGNVVQEKIISGHPLLVQAALKAVLERKYEPTVLDGVPTPVDLRVEVNFHM
jgi:protein TonB